MGYDFVALSHETGGHLAEETDEFFQQLVNHAGGRGPSDEARFRHYTLPRASISRTRSGSQRLSSPTSRSHRPHAAGLDLYSATSPSPGISKTNLEIWQKEILPRHFPPKLRRILVARGSKRNWREVDSPYSFSDYREVAC